jgi:uncharacterized repeat protein (TIGR02543 family)
MLKLFLSTYVASMVLSVGIWRTDGVPSGGASAFPASLGTFYVDGVLPAEVQSPAGAAVFAYYKMDDYAGDNVVLDSSGKGRNMAHGSGATMSYSATGAKDAALWTVPNFPMSLPSSVTALMGANDFSFAFWIRIQPDEGYTWIFGASYLSCYAYINNTYGNIVVQAGDSWPVVASVDAFPAWHHVCFVKKGELFSVWYDGVLSEDGVDGSNWTSDNLTFFNDAGYENEVLVDELIFYSGALTGQQVSDLYNSYDVPMCVAATFVTGLFASDMGLPGAFNLEYSTKTYAKGSEIGVFPTLTSNDPRYSFSDWRYVGGDFLSTWSTVYDGLVACAYWSTVSPSGMLYFNSQSGSSIMDSWDLYEGFTFEIPYLGHFWPADPVYEGYVFGGWFSGTEGQGYSINPQGVYDSMTFGSGYMYAFAYWTLAPITFTFNSGVPLAGTGIPATDIPGIENYATYDYTEITYGAGAEMTAMPAASVAGPRYTFSGYWYDAYYSVVYQAGSYAPLNNYPHVGPVPLYAMWDDGGFEGTLAFDSMDGTPVTLTKNLFDGSGFGTGDFGELSWPEDPTKSGYVFNGWNTQADGQGLAGVTYATQYVNAYGSTVTLYAMWASE